eukprot:1158048-Pelagomonas_calceolata.AAC.9
MDPSATARDQEGGCPKVKGLRHRGACCSCCTKPAGVGQGAWVARLDEPMEVSEDSPDEAMEGGGE